MNEDIPTASRPTFKGTLRRTCVIGVVISMLIVWLCLSVASMLTLRQYAQKNLELLAVTVSHSLKAAVVLRDGVAANETLTVLGKQGQFTAAKFVATNGKEIIHWQADKPAQHGMVGGLVTRWLYSHPIKQPIWHNGKVIGEMHLIGMDATVTLFVWLSLVVLTACILLASIIAVTISRQLHRDIDAALQNFTDVARYIRRNLNFSRRVPPEKIEEFHLFALDFNSLLDEMEEWQRQLEFKNASLQRAALRDALTGLENRAAFRHALDKLIADTDALQNSALLFMDGDDFKFINDAWGHAAGDAVLIEVAKRLLMFADPNHRAFRLGGDEFAMLLFAVNSDLQAKVLLTQLKELVEKPIQLPSEQWVTMTLSVGVALAKDITSAEVLMEIADRNMYIEKHKQRELHRKQHQMIASDRLRSRLRRSVNAVSLSRPNFSSVVLNAMLPSLLLPRRRKNRSLTVPAIRPGFLIQTVAYGAQHGCDETIAAQRELEVRGTVGCGRLRTHEEASALWIGAVEDTEEQPIALLQCPDCS